MNIKVKQWFSWRPTRRQLLWAIGIGCLLVALATFIFLGYRLNWEWTGFSQKKLFDWIQILVIPVAVAAGIFVLNRAAKRRDDEAQKGQREYEQAVEAQRAEEASLQTYLNYISQMLTDPKKPLRRSHMGDNLSVVARAQTLTVLGRLENGARKGSAIQFLSEAGLISGTYPVISLNRADLNGADLGGANLNGANLSGAYLFGANLSGADLNGADLGGADLSGANLSGANLFGAYLRGANLNGANLTEADLFGANLFGANLNGADLNGADLGGADLFRADLSGAIGVTQDQIDRAHGNEDTILPEGFDRPKSWSDRTDEHIEEG